MKKNFTTALVAIFTFVSGLAQAQSQYVVNGNATNISTMVKPNSFQLTPDAKNQSGTVWNKTKIDILANSFVLTFKANFGTKDATGAEGIALVLQNDASGTATLGSGNQNPMGFQGIKPALNIEFDTYNNGTSSNDIAADHISISKNGISNSGHQLTTAVQANATNANIEDGTDHDVEVDWDANTNTMYVFFDGSLRQAYTGNVVTDIFSGNGSVYWGFTSSTGNSTNLQSVYQLSMTLTPVTSAAASKSPSVLPVSLVNFAAAKSEKGNVLAWSTATEKNSDHFQVERSANATTWVAIGKVASHINSTTLQQYSFTDNATSATVYYRLKMVDLDGTTEYSKVVTVKSSALQVYAVSVYPNPVQNAETLTIKLTATESAATTVSLTDMMGNVVKNVAQTAQIGENTFTIETANLKPGMYMVQAATGTTKETTRVLVK